MSLSQKREKKQIDFWESLDVFSELTHPQMVHAALSMTSRDHLNLVAYQSTETNLRKEHVEIYFPKNLDVKYSDANGLVAVACG